MIGIIYIGQVQLSPFVKKYVSIMEEKKLDYEIVHWNRSGIPCPDDENYRTFSLALKRYGNLISKTIPFLKFKRYMKRIIEQQKYDKLIVLTTQTALMVPCMLTHKYKGRYFFDYRDASYEYFKPYKRLVDSIIEASAYTCISSPGFKKHLTQKKELILAHNFQYAYYNERVTAYKKSNNPKIILGYIGYLREYAYLKQLVELFSCDPRFEFHIYGSGDCLNVLKEDCKNFKNVFVFGAYDEKDKMKIIDSFDMICYNYPPSFVNYPAIANKFYDGIIRKKPMLGNAGTFSGKLINEHYLGVSIEENTPGATDKIYNFFTNMDGEKFCKSCETYLQTVIDDDKYYLQCIHAFLDT